MHERFFLSDIQTFQYLCIQVGLNVYVDIFFKGFILFCCLNAERNIIILRFWFIHEYLFRAFTPKRSIYLTFLIGQLNNANGFGQICVLTNNDLIQQNKTTIVSDPSMWLSTFYAMNYGELTKNP